MPVLVTANTKRIQIRRILMQDTKMQDTKTRLSALWLFATLNYLYCEVVTR